MSMTPEQDWQQVVLNGGPPCFHVEGNRFCFRAERWLGHNEMHCFVSLTAFVNRLILEARLEGWWKGREGNSEYRKQLESELEGI